MTLCTNNTPSQNEYTGNGAITEYSITFQYYSQSDIFVAFYDTATEAWVNVSTSDWSFLNPTVIKFNTAPADNQRILIYRCTDIDPLPAEFFPGNSIKAADLNNNFFVMKSAIEEINTQSGTSDTLAKSAKATADAANTKADTAIATANTASTNASSAVTTANTADTNATTALNAANSATSTANTALSTANTANTTANTANTTANTANTAATAASSDASAAVSSANAAVTTANAADTNATTALNTANSVAGVANTANTNATTALTTANTALTTANTANTTANNALSQVNAANPWTESNGVVGLLNTGSNVGIGGTSTSLRKLTVNDGSNDTFIAVRSNDTGKSGLLLGDQTKDFVGQIVYHNPDHALAFHVNTSERMRLTPAGLGIGTSNPLAKLTVSTGSTAITPVVDADELLLESDGNAGMTIATGPDSTGNIYFAESLTGVSRGALVYDTSTDHMAFSTGGLVNERLRITSTGLVGVGTNSPTTNLEVVSSLAQIKARSTGATNPSRLQLDNVADPGLSGGQIVGQWDGSPVARIDFKNGADATNRDDGEITFHTSASGNLANERARITSSGNFGINTSTPPAILTVTAGNSSSTAYAGRSLNYGALVHTVSGRSGYIVQNTNAFTTANDNAGFQWLYPFDSGGDSNYKVFRSAAGTTLADKFWVNQGGGAYFANNVGIGTTSANNKLEVASHAQHRIGIKSTDTTMTTGSDYGGIRFSSSHASNPRSINWDIYQVAGNTAGNTNLIINSHADSIVTMLSGGNIGLNWSTPGRPLVVNRSTTNSWVSVRSSDTGRAGILLGDQTADNTAQLAYDNSSEALQFVSAGSERMRLTASPGGTRLGIGTSAPKRMLHVNNATTHAFATITSANTSIAGILFGTQTDDARGQIYYDNSTDALSFVTNNSSPAKMTISQTGVVDINGSLTVNGQAITPGGGGGGGGSSSSTYKNVKTDFGAVGNGTTDDTTAVTNALNSGGTIYFPEGTYRITSTLSHTTGFNVVGDGQQSRIMYDKASNNTSLFNLQTNVRHDNAKKWSFSSIALSCKAVANRIHESGIKIQYTGAATVIGGTNYLELNDVHIVSEMTTDATQAYFKYGLRTVNIGGIVASNLNISTFNVNAENDASTVGIQIENNLSGHAVIRAFTGTNIYLQRYHKGLYATKAGGGQNIESIYMTQGEIVCKVGIHLDASHATFIGGMHIECQKESYINSSDGGPHRVVGCDLRAGRNGTQNLTDYMIKIGVDNCSFTGNYITSQMPSSGCIRTGGSTGNPDNVSIVGNIFNGNGSSTYRALSCESGSANVIFTGNVGSGFGGNTNPVFNTIGSGSNGLLNTNNKLK